MNPSYRLGLLFILAVALIWAASSVLTQYVFFEMAFPSPFLFTYITNTLFVVYLPLYDWRIYQASLENKKANDPKHVQRVKHKMFRIALNISPFWFVANGLYNYSLLWTSVSSSTIISNLAGVFTLLFSCMAHLEVFTIGKLLGVLLSFVGVVLVAVHDSDDSTSGTVHGDLLALASAAGYGMYTTVLRYQVHDDGLPVDLVLGYIGLINATCLTPFILLFSHYNIENINSCSLFIILVIAANGFFDQVLSDYIWARSVLLTSPTVATVGMSITIPLAIITDLFLKGIIPGIYAVIGSTMVVAGFLWVTAIDEKEEHAAITSTDSFTYDSMNMDDDFDDNLAIPSALLDGGDIGVISEEEGRVVISHGLVES